MIGPLWIVVPMHHIASDHAEWNSRLLVADDSIEDEGAS
jgi:hypothetical protein